MIRRLLLVLFLLSLTGASVRPAERVAINIIATSDLHGYIYPFDYYANRPADRGLAKAATIIKRLRHEDPDALLVDCGDTIEGSPLEYVHAHQVLAHDPQAGADPGPDPMMLAMNELDYDAMVVGNHEFSFGMQPLLQAKREAHFPWLAANVLPAANVEEAVAIRDKNFPAAYKAFEERVFVPMTVEEAHGVSVAIIGLTTPVTPNYEREEHVSGYHFESVIDSAREWVRYARETRHADVVVIAAHLGLERSLDDRPRIPSQLPEENAVYELASKVRGIDGIIFGHTHQELAGRSVNGVILVQPRFWGQSVARMTFTLEKDAGDAWKIAGKASEVIPVNSLVAADPEILHIAEPYHAAAQKYLDTRVAELKTPLETRLVLAMDNPALAVIHEVQLAESRAAGFAADVSFAAIYDANLRIPAGPVTIREISALYPYENELIVVEGDGQMLKDALEQNQSEMASGADGNLKYKIDLTMPAGQRIVDLQWKGAPLDPRQKLRVALNSYRKAGGGGYTVFRGAKVLWRSPENIRELMIAYYTKRKTIGPIVVP